MTEIISFADWVGWLAIELTFTELYESAAESLRHEMAATLWRLADGIGEEELGEFTSRVPSFERALDSFSPEEQRRFMPQFVGHQRTRQRTRSAPVRPMWLAQARIRPSARLIRRVCAPTP